MGTSILITSDNSKTLFNPKYQEYYHNTNGALTESTHIYIENGLKNFDKQHISILEIGYGTGLNAINTYVFNNELKNNIYYHGIDNNPISNEDFINLNYSSIFNKLSLDLNHFNKYWDEKLKLENNFILYKENRDLLSCKIPKNTYDLVYYDAFSPESQPEMWSIEIIRKVTNSLKNGGILLSYCSKGLFKSNLRACNMHVKRLKGPLGKRHIIKATKLK